MDGWLYEKITGIEQALAYIINKIDEEEKQNGMQRKRTHEKGEGKESQSQS